jgi:hypothetical protein
MCGKKRSPGSDCIESDRQNRRKTQCHTNCDEPENLDCLHSEMISRGSLSDFFFFLFLFFEILRSANAKQDATQSMHYTVSKGSFDCERSPQVQMALRMTRQQCIMPFAGSSHTHNQSNSAYPYMDMRDMHNLIPVKI